MYVAGLGCGAKCDDSKPHGIGLRHGPRGRGVGFAQTPARPSDAQQWLDQQPGTVTLDEARDGRSTVVTLDFPFVSDPDGGSRVTSDFPFVSVPGAHGGQVVQPYGTGFVDNLMGWIEQNQTTAWILAGGVAVLGIMSQRRGRRRR